MCNITIFCATISHYVDFPLGRGCANHMYVLVGASQYIVFLFAWLTTYIIFSRWGRAKHIVILVEVLQYIIILSFGFPILSWFVMARLLTVYRLCSFCLACEASTARCGNCWQAASLDFILDYLLFTLLSLLFAFCSVLFTLHSFLFTLYYLLVSFTFTRTLTPFSYAQTYQHTGIRARERLSTRAFELKSTRALEHTVSYTHLTLPTKRIV